MKFKPEVTAQMFWDSLAEHTKNYPAMMSFMSWARSKHPEWLEPEVRPCVCGGTEFEGLESHNSHDPDGFTNTMRRHEYCKSCGTVRVKKDEK